ncbi:MAG: Lar family restriction alleviation protein [Anaerostipes sp.]|uniref:Lar family restriction alleviation protein n=1 Tax=Anaerostipes sp. TaxID=1872530 RepID=UPI003993DDB9
MSDIELKPCPFCESENVNLLSVNKDGEAVCITSTDEFELIHDMQEPTYIHCYGCDMDYMPDSDKPEEVVDSWNTRKPMERIMEQLEDKMDHSFNQRYRAFWRSSNDS